jgi:competence protein ComEC
VLIGVMADRPALTLRTLSVAALAVMALSPEAVIHPSFQMSFAATLALIAIYERGLPRFVTSANTSFAARAALWGAHEIVALILASLVAGLATTPYAAFHFHRLAPYGVVANLLAMPVVSVLVMPAGIVGLLAMPFGFDAPFWRLMELGIDWMVAVALWVGSLPGAVGRVPAFGAGALLVGTAGLIVLCLLRTPLRALGAVVAVVGCLLAVHTPQPDVLVGASGDSFAVRGPNGRLQVLKTGNDAFGIREWLAADGDDRQPAAASAAHEGFICDDAGCVAKLSRGGLVAIATSPAAFADDCARAVLVVTTRAAPPHCAAVVVDRNLWRAGGALALHRTGPRWEITAARPSSQDRPWAPVARSGARVRTPTTDGPAARDATPRPEDLGADD